MKNLLIAAAVTGGLIASTTPTFAQFAMTSQPGWAANADNAVPGSSQAPNDPALDYYQSPNYEGGSGNDTYVGRGSASDYLSQQQDSQYTPGHNQSGTRARSLMVGTGASQR